MHDFGFLRIAAAIPSVNVADCSYNIKSIINQIDQACQHNAEVVLFPELSVTGYSCADLFAQSVLLDSAVAGLEAIRQHSAGLGDVLIVVGAPLKNGDKLFNTAVAICQGCYVGVVPKTFLPNYNEFYECRWFASASECNAGSITIADTTDIPFGTDIIINKGSARIAIELCEDLWTPIPPSSYNAVAGANVILNLSASDEVIGKHAYLFDLIKQQSAKLRCAYVYSSAGFGESSTDVVYAGNGIICENGRCLAKTARFVTNPQLAIADIDIERLTTERQKANTFRSETPIPDSMTVDVPSVIRHFSDAPLRNDIYPTPFIPDSDKILNARCEEIINIQAMGLMRRLSFTHTKHLVVGISGGLDSTLAILVAVEAFDRLGLDRKGIVAITMPGFGTTDRTYTNALLLMKHLSVTLLEIPIRDAVKQHFTDINHDISIHDVTYENCQARERTQILMDYANKVGGMVLGTGDLSELALGWATYNGDHMSMYGVNSGVPKTLVKHLVRWYASIASDNELKATLLDIVDTPISPELTPADKNGQIAQKTEDLVGPYELHDFFLYYCVRFGFAPDKIYFLAKAAFRNRFDDETIKKWLKTFFRRFFNQQFKRSCLPDGPKVGSVTLSPRGDWRMPSDASANLWLDICNKL